MSLIQRRLQSAHSLSQSQHHAVSQLRTRQLALEDATARTLNLEMRLRLGQDWLRDKGQMLPSSPLAPAALPPAAASSSFLSQLIFDVFSPSRSSRLALSTKPFGYSSEQAYAAIVAGFRASPSALLPQCLAASGSWVQAGENRRWVGSLCRSLVWDVLDDEEAVLEFVCSTLRCMQHDMQTRQDRKNRDSRDADETASAAQTAEERKEEEEEGESSPASVTPPRTLSPQPLTITTNSLSVTSNAIVPLAASSFSVLDHSALPLKLLHEYNLRFGAAYLQSTLSASLALVLSDSDHIDLNIDLMGSSPRAAKPAAANSSSVSDRLFNICSHLLEAITGSVASMPHGIRRITRLLFTLGSSPSSASSASSSDPLTAMHDPASPYRITSDYLFLNWLINAVMHPELYHLLPLSPPLSPLHRRNLQVVATVLIKLMSGSRFVFEGGRLAVLNDFLDAWRGRVVSFIEECCDLRDEKDTAAGRGLQQTETQAKPELSAGLPASASAGVIAMLPNDLFCLHWLLLAWKKDEVEAAKAEKESRKLSNGTSTPPSILSSSFVSPSASLVSLLVNLDTPPAYLSLSDNLYVLLSSGFPSLSVPALPPFPARSRTLSLCADMLTHILSLLPLLPSSFSSSSSLLSVLSDAARREEDTGNPAAGLATSECISLLSSLLPSPSHRSFLVLMVQWMDGWWQQLRQAEVSREAVWGAGVVEERTEELRRREAAVMAGLRLLQVRRVMEMVRVRVKRLKKLFAQRGEKEKEGGAAAGAAGSAGKERRAAAPSSSPLAPPYPASLLSASSGCGGSFPDSLNSDRFLCSSCMKLLEKRRVLLRSFYTKYIVGDDAAASTTSSSAAGSSLLPPSGAAASNSHPVNFSLSPPAAPTAAPVASAFGSAAAFSPSVGTEPGEGHSLLNLSLGPPLALLDPVVQSDLSDMINSSCYAEVWVQCERAVRVWWLQCEAVKAAIDTDFGVWYALMALGEREVGSDGLSVDDVKRMMREKAASTAKTAAGGGGGRGLSAEERVRRMRVPYLSTATVRAVEKELRRLGASTSGKEKVESIARIRAMVFACISNASMIRLRRRRQREQQRRLQPTHANGLSGGEEEEDDGDESVEAGSVDDYMCLLSFLLLSINPYGLLCQLSFVRLLHAPAASSKPFVDVLTAVKYIFGMQSTLAAALHFTPEMVERAKHGGRPALGETAGGGRAGVERSVSVGDLLTVQRTTSRPHSSLDVRHDNQQSAASSSSSSSSSSPSSTSTPPAANGAEESSDSVGVLYRPEI